MTKGILTLFLLLVVALSSTKVLSTPTYRGTVSCILLHCRTEAASCFSDSSCRSAAFCDAGCQLKKQKQACDLVCELNQGYNSTKYRKMMQCMADHTCLPVQPSDGICLAQDNQTLQNLTHISQMKGKWWIVRGMNCGQSGWPAGFDYFPCQRDEFVTPPPGFPSDTWVDNIAYCGGSIILRKRT